MTLLITVFAAIISTVLWYTKPKSNMKIELLSLMYCSASLMWFVDAAVEYFDIGAEYFTPSPSDILNDSYLGISVVALGLIIWLAVVFIKDPKGRIRETFAAKK